MGKYIFSVQLTKSRIGNLIIQLGHNVAFFFEFFVPLLFSHCMTSTSYLVRFFLPVGIFHYLVTTCWIFDISFFRENSIDRPINQILC